MDGCRATGWSWFSALGILGMFAICGRWWFQSDSRFLFFHFLPHSYGVEPQVWNYSHFSFWSFYIFMSIRRVAGLPSLFLPLCLSFWNVYFSQCLYRNVSCLSLISCIYGQWPPKKSLLSIQNFDYRFFSFTYLGTYGSSWSSITAIGMKKHVEPQIVTFVLRICIVPCRWDADCMTRLVLIIMPVQSYNMYKYHVILDLGTF